MSMLRASLDAENYDREYENNELIQRVAAYFRPHLGKFSLIVLMVCFLSLTTAALPILIGKVLEVISVNKAQAGQLTLGLVFGVLLVGVLGWAAGRTCRRCSRRTRCSQQ